MLCSEGSQTFYNDDSELHDPVFINLEVSLKLNPEGIKWLEAITVTQPGERGYLTREGGGKAVKGSFWLLHGTATEYAVSLNIDLNLVTEEKDVTHTQNNKIYFKKKLFYLVLRPNKIV